MSERILLNTKQAAGYLGISRTTFLRFVADGRVAAGIKLGPRAIRWHVSDLEAYVERCRAASAPASN